MTSQSWNPIWDEVFASKEWGKYPAESLIQFVARNFYKRNRPEVRLLEVGCGTGANLWYMCREGFDVYGIDASQVALNIARARIEKEGLRATLQLGDITELPFPDQYFDGVVDVECIYANNRTNTCRILTEINRVMKTGGKFYSRTFSDEITVGVDDKPVAFLEYDNITMGPLIGTGFARLSNRQTINELYGASLFVEQIDTLRYTMNNGEVKMSEYLVICSRRE